MKKIITITSALLISLSFTACYSWWESKTPMDSDTPHIDLSDFLYNEPAVTSLEAPVQVLASQGLYKDTIKLRWSEVQNATSYRIERAVVTPDVNGNYTEPEDGDFKLLEKYVYKTTYDDVVLTNAIDSSQEYNNIYYYRISAENIRRGLESSPYTDIKSMDTKANGWLLSPPQNLSVDKGKSQDSINVSWDGIANAKYYLIFRGEKSNGIGMEQIQKVRGNQLSYTDKITENEQGKEFYYKVCAELSSGQQSAFTSLGMGYTLKDGAPDAPEEVKIIDGYGDSISGIKIEWKNSVSTSPDQTLTFSVFRSSSVDSSFTQIFSNLDASCTSIVDTSSLKPGIIYYYYVQSVIEKNGDVSKSPFSESGPESENPAQGFLLSAPSEIEVLDTENSSIVLLTWKPSIGTEAPFNKEYTYSVYVDTDLNGNFETAIETKISPVIKNGLYEIEATKYPFYKITTINSAGLESKKSSVIAPNPASPLNVKATKTSDLGDLSKYRPNTNNVYPVLVTWDAPITETPYGYHVYRSTKPDSSFRKLTEEPITNGITYFIDENETARAGTLYYYKVVSVNIMDKGKNGNNPTEDKEYNCAGYGALTRDQWFREYNATVMQSQSKLTLMHKSNDMDKLGSETIKGYISGTLFYKAVIAGLGAEITMHYENYCEYYVNNDEKLGGYFIVTGNTDTTSNMSANGNMHGIVNVTGMYPGKVDYGKLQIKSGAAGGGTYNVETYDLNGKTLLPIAGVSWTVGEENRK